MRGGRFPVASRRARGHPMSAGRADRGEGVTALAHPNVALSKYWGKRPGAGNFPAVPSLSVTLAGLTTRTRVRWTREGTGDRVVLNGKELDAAASARARELLDRVRKAA